MKYRIGKAGLIALAISFEAAVAYANTQKSDATTMPATSSQADKAGNKGKSSKAIKAVDINSASKAELKTLPSIDGVRADKIIAGRPYPSKAFLVSRNVISLGVYAEIRKQIIAMPK